MNNQLIIQYQYSTLLQKSFSPMICYLIAYRGFERYKTLFFCSFFGNSYLFGGKRYEMSNQRVIKFIINEKSLTSMSNQYRTIFWQHSMSNQLITSWLPTDYLLMSKITDQLCLVGNNTNTGQTVMNCNFSKVFLRNLYMLLCSLNQF